MTRREWMALAYGWTSSAAVLVGQHGGRRMPSPAADLPIVGDADITLRIGAVNLEIGPRRVVRTLAYNGAVPGPLLRARRGRPLTVDVWNDSPEHDIVHWHGLHIPPEVDGVYEEGTPGVPPNGGRRRYVFTPEPAGTRWYHSHNPAGRDLKKSTYSGQFGMLVVDDGADPGAYDQEVPLLLHEWEPFFRRNGPLDVEFKAFSINGKMLGAAEPIRVRAGQRVLFRIVNASATLAHELALPGHQFRVVALDGNPAPTPLAVPIVALAPGERVDAIVEMNRPGVWVCGGLKPAERAAGLGIVVEYAGATGPPQWIRRRAPGTTPSSARPARRGPSPMGTSRWRFAPPAMGTTGQSTASGTRRPIRSWCGRAVATAGGSTTRAPTPIRCTCTGTPSSWWRSRAGPRQACGRTWWSCLRGSRWRSR